MTSAGSIRAARAFVELTVEKAVLKRDLRLVRGLISNALDQIGKAGAKLTIAGAGGALTFAPFIKSASDAQETLNRFKQVFGTQSRAADQFAEELAGKTGRAVSGIRDSLASFDAFFKGLGFDDTRAREMSQTLSELAVDFASFNNMSDSEAVGRFISAMSGSSEVLDRYGINLKQAALEQQLLQSGLADSAASATEAQKAMARLDIIAATMGRTGATGDASRTINQLANSFRSAQAQFSRISQAIGAALLPAVEAIMPAVRDVLGWVAELIEQNPILARVLAGTAVAAAGLGVALIGLVAIGKTLFAVSAAITAVGLAMRVASIASGGGPAFAALLAGLGASAKGLIASLGAIAARVVGLAAAFKTAVIAGVRLSALVTRLAGLAGLTYGAFLLADAFGLAGKKAATAAEQMERLQRVQDASASIAAANLDRRMGDRDSSAARIAAIDSMLETRDRTIAQLAQRLADARANGDSAAWDRIQNQLRSVAPESFQALIDSESDVEVRSIMQAIKSQQDARMALVDERRQLQAALSKGAAGNAGNPESFAERRAELLDEQAVALGRMTEAQREFNALVRDGFNRAQANGLTILQEQLRAIEAQAQAQLKLEAFQDRRVALLEREAVLKGQLTEQQARINELVRQGYSQRQAAEIAGLESNIAGLEGQDTMASQISNRARGGNRAAGSGLRTQQFFEFPRSQQNMQRQQLEEQRKARELLQQIADANNAGGNVVGLHI